MSIATHIGGHAPSESNPDSSQAARPVPFIGCRLSLISKVGVRYEGTLLGVDSDKGELTLGNARSYGTEDRRVERPIAPQPYEYQSITFKGDSINELMVPEAPLPPVGADPAVVQAQSAPGPRACVNPLSALTGNWPQGAGVQAPFTSAAFPGFPIGTPAQASQPRVPLSSSAPLMPGALMPSTLSTMLAGRPPFPPGVQYIQAYGMPPIAAGGPHGPIGAPPVGYQQAAPPAHAPPTSMGPIAPPGARPPAPFQATQTTPSIARELAPPYAFASPPQLGPSPPAAAPAPAGFVGQARPAPQPTAPVSPPQPQAPPAQPQSIRVAPEQPPAPIQSPVNKPMSGFQAPNLPPRLAAQANDAFSQSPQARAQPPQAPSQPASSSASRAPGQVAPAPTQQQAAQVTPQVDRQRPQAPDAFADRNKQKVEEEPYEEADEGEQSEAHYAEPGDKQTRGPSGGSWPAATSQPVRTNRIVEYPPDDDDTVAVENFEGAAGGASPPQRASARPMKFDKFGSSSYNRPPPDSQGFQHGFGMGRGRPRGGRFQRGGLLPAWSQDNQLEVPAIPGQLGAPRMTVTLNTSFTNRSGADNASQTSTSTRRTLEPETPRGFGGFYVGRGGTYSRGLPRGGAQQYHRPMEYEQYGNEYEEDRGGFYEYSQTSSRGRGWYSSAPMGHQGAAPSHGYQDVGYGAGAPPQGSALRGRARGYSGTRGGSAGAQQQQQQRSSNRPELNWPSSNSRWGGWGWSGGGGGGGGGQPANSNLSFNAGQRPSGFQSAFGQSGYSAYRGRGAGAQQVKRQQPLPRPRRGSDGELNAAKISVNVGNDYDFESNNAEFAKLVDALSIDGLDKSDVLSPTEGHTEEGLEGEGEGEGRALEEGELAENEPASKEHEGAAASESAGEESAAASTAGVGAVNLSVQLNVNVNAGAATNRVSGSNTPSQPTANTYSKKTSFFDNLKSGENNKEAPSAGHMSDDRKLNVETFGPAAANLRRFGQRTRYRGMSRGARGGYQRGRWPR